LAERFARDGACIALLDISPSVQELTDSLAASGAKVASACADVADAGQVNEAVRLLETRLGPVDCLVNNAGLTGNIAPLARMKVRSEERRVGKDWSTRWAGLQNEQYRTETWNMGS